MRSLFKKHDRFIRDSVVTGEFAYRIDGNKSQFAAHVESDYRWWTIELKSIDTDYPDDDEDRMPPLQGPRLDLVLPRSLELGDWASLEFTNHKFGFDDTDAFPLVPGIASGAYAGDEHQSCVEHEVSFGYTNDSIQLRWRTLAKADKHDPGTKYHIDADLDFKGVKVPLHASADEAEAEPQFIRYFDRSEFGDPKRELDHVWYPRITAVDEQDGT